MQVVRISLSEFIELLLHHGKKEYIGVFPGESHCR
jgi:hypothetical protein